MVSRKIALKRLKVLGITYLGLYLVFLFMIYNRTPSFPISDAVLLFSGYFYSMYVEFLYISSVHISDLMALLAFFIPVGYVFLGTYVMYFFRLLHSLCLWE